MRIALAHAASSLVPGPLLELTRTLNGALQFRVSGLPGLPYRVESSQDLADWVGVAIANSPDGETRLSPTPDASSPSRFYRATTVNEEFFGPFPSWANAKADFGAIGNGQADDTAALQKALDALRPYTNRSVLYIPKGVYRITQTLRVTRQEHSESKDIMILGEDPAITRVVWDGATNGVMLDYGAWYSRLGRLTFDGRGQARTAIAHGTNFATHNEFSDLVIQDTSLGIEGGKMGDGGIAETVVTRCRFSRCSIAAISIQNWNSLDWFVWHCEFRDCRLGVCNTFGAGNFHVYESLFRNSSEADIAIGNTEYFSIRHNTSIGSRAFFVAGNNGASAPITLQDNRVFGASDVPVQIGNLGALVLLDNIFKTRDLPALQFNNPAARLVSFGNLVTSPGAIPSTASALCWQDRLETAGTLDETLPHLPETPPGLNRAVQEVPAGSSTAALQAIIDAASRMTNEWPVIHLPAGTFWVTNTLNIPARARFSMVGDGARSSLVWSSPRPGPVLRILGPTCVTLRDLSIFSSTNAEGIVVENCDQNGGRIYADQVDARQVNGPGLFVDRLANVEVDLESFYHMGNKVGVRVVGAGVTTHIGLFPARTAIFGGGAADNELCYEVRDGGNLLVQDSWYESQLTNCTRFLSCTNSGSFTLNGGSVGPMESRSNIPVVEVNNFSGRVAILTAIFVFPNTRIAVLGDRSDMNVLLLGNVSSNEPELQTNSSGASMLKSFRSTPGGGAVALSDLGTADANFVSLMLAPIREQKPPQLAPLKEGMTDLRLHRVFVQRGTVGIHLKPAGPQKQGGP